MRKKGSHTWDLFLAYHRCPACGFILENREDYQMVKGKYIKEFACPRCGVHFVQEKPEVKAKGPLFGTAPKPEFDWSE